MKWLLKASVQKALSVIPSGDAFNYLLQRHVARTVPLQGTDFRRRFRRALNHFEAFSEHGETPPNQAVFYEFGAGRDLIVALAYWAFGVERQIIVDIRPLVRLELVNNSLATFSRLADEFAAEAGRSLRSFEPPVLTSLTELRDRFGIEYLAPRDVANTGLPADSVDFVSNTATLEHVPPNAIGPLLSECVRLLKPRGLMSSAIDLKDHFSYMDKGLSPYNFLRFESGTWRLVTSPLNYQNRLRYPDYLALFLNAGFEIVAEKVVRPSAGDIETLRRLPLAEPFRNDYSLEDLGVKALRIVARPRSPNA